MVACTNSLRKKNHCAEESGECQNHLQCIKQVFATLVVDKKKPCGRHLEGGAARMESGGIRRKFR
jgi:hypothetical protein